MNNYTNTNKEIWKISNTNELVLKNNHALLLNDGIADNDKTIINIYAHGLRYYTAATFDTRNSALINGDFFFDDVIISDTVLCVKSRKTMGIADEVIGDWIVTIPPSNYYKYFYIDSNKLSNNLKEQLKNNPCIAYESGTKTPSDISESTDIAETLKWQDVTNKTDNALNINNIFIVNTTNDPLYVIYPHNVYANHGDNFPCLNSIPNKIPSSYFFNVNDISTTVKAYLENPDTSTNVFNINLDDNASPAMSIFNPITNVSITVDESIYIYNYNVYETAAAGQPFANDGAIYYGNMCNEYKVDPFDETIPAVYPSAWYPNMANMYLVTLSNAINAIGNHLNSINGYPYYYTSPNIIPSAILSLEENSSALPTPQRIKYVMGYASDLLNDSDCWLSDLSDVATTNIPGVTDRKNNTPFGIFDYEHLPLRKTTGFAWPLITLDAYTATSNTNTEDTELSAKILSGQCFTKYNDEIELPSSLLNIDDIYFTNEVLSAVPTIWNIPFIKTLNDSDPITFNLNGTSLNDIWSPITLPSAFTKYYPNADIFETDNTTFNDSALHFKLLNLDKVYNALYNVIKTDANWTDDILTMTVTTTIPLDGQSTMFGIRDLSITDSNKTINWKLETADEFNPIMHDENGTIGYLINRTELISDLLSQTDAEINKSLIIGSQSISELYASLSGDSTPKTTDYLNMRVDVGSIFTEYPIISNVDNITQPTETEKEISFQTTYSFKNLADFVLFYYYYKHTINHYLCKLSLLFKSFKFYANQLNNNGTLSDVLDNPSAYFNNKNVAEILTLNSLISNDCFWRGFINDNTIDNKYYDMSLLSNMSISPVGNMNWTLSDYQSDLINKNIVEYETTLGTFTDNTAKTSIASDEQIDYNNNLKKLYSFYRPYYMLYKNMFIAGTNSSTYNDAGFCYGCLKITDTTYTLNRDAINQDYGWIDENGNFNIDNILNAAEKINYNGLNEDSK